MKDPNDDIPLEEEITEKYNFDPGRRIEQNFYKITDISSSVMQYSEILHANHRIEKRKQPDKIADALERCKQQMIVRDNHKPEYFIWSLELKEDDKSFGFVRQVEKNRLTKFVIDISFIKASQLLQDYFNSKVSVVSTNISNLSKKELGDAVK